MPPVEQPAGKVLPCLGEYNHENCSVRVGCARYQLLSVEHTEFVRITTFGPEGFDQHIPLVPSRLAEILRRDAHAIEDRR
jgi:hypothetical protein